MKSEVLCFLDKVCLWYLDNKFLWLYFVNGTYKYGENVLWFFHWLASISRYIEMCLFTKRSTLRPNRINNLFTRQQTEQHTARAAETRQNRFH